MSDVQPIRKPNQIKAVCSYLWAKDEKYYIMFIIGIQSGLRISDILQLRVTDIDKMRDTKISEKKTGKKRFLYYKKTHNIVPLMRIFNHSSQDITLKYIGIEPAEIEDSLKDFVLF